MNRSIDEVRLEKNMMAAKRTLDAARTRYNKTVNELSRYRLMNRRKRQ